MSTDDLSRADKVLICPVRAVSHELIYCIEAHSDYCYREASIILFMAPQVIAVKSVSRFCDSMRAKGAVVFAKGEWPGTAEAWEAAEKRFPPFRIGPYEVSLDLWKKKARISICSWHGGGVSFNLCDCSADMSYGIDRMNAGGVTVSFDRQKRITAGDVLSKGADFLRWASDGGDDIRPEMCVDNTVVWPVLPYADMNSREAMYGYSPSRPVEDGASKPVKNPVSKSSGMRSALAIQRDEAARREIKAKRDADARNELTVKLLPFIERHAADNENWDACAGQILLYFEVKDGGFRDAVENRHWNITADCIESVESWESHSFFDDGGGISGYTRTSITYVESEEKDTAVNLSEGRYPPGGAPVRSHSYRRDPFGLKGLFRFSHERAESYTD